MHYYIDGYNLLFHILHTGESLQEQRLKLISDLQTKISCLELDVTIVFDSHYQKDNSTRSHLNLLEIIFTSKGETADEFILQDLKRCASPKNHTVVTSDKKLSWLCRRLLAKTESVVEFITWLNKRYKNRLRQKKITSTSEKNLPPLLQKQQIPEPKVFKSITKKSSTEECFDYYLETFEKNLSEQTPPNSTKKSRTSKPLSNRSKKKIPSSKKQSFLSDTQRWLQQFENNEKNNDDLNF